MQLLGKCDGESWGQLERGRDDRDELCASMKASKNIDMYM